MAKKDGVVDTVVINIPKDRINQGNRFIYAAVNGESYLIQRGKPLAVPRKIAEIIMESMEQDEAAMDFIDHNAE